MANIPEKCRAAVLVGYGRPLEIHELPVPEVGRGVLWWRVHAQFDDAIWLREIATCKVPGPDGYLCEPLWINPVNAATRGIRNGDIVKIYNERDSVLGGACITERIIPGAVYQDHGARYDPIVSWKLDRAGTNNTICPHYVTSRNAAGEVTSGYLVQVERFDVSNLML